MSSQILSIAGTIAVFPWPFFILLSYWTTCTQGSPDSWLASLIYCSVTASVSLISFLFSLRVDGIARYFRLCSPFFMFTPLFFTIRHAYETTILENHLCGEEFNHIVQDQLLSRYYFPVLWVLAILVSIAAVYPLRALFAEQNLLDKSESDCQE